MPRKRKAQNKKQEMTKAVATESALPPEKLIQDFLSKAESDINTFNYESAVEHCQSALAVDPKNIKAIEMLADTLMDIHDIGQAESLYLKSVELCPDEGYAKYLSLGQISEGKRSLEFYQKGISIIEKMMEETENTEPDAISKETSQPLCRILSDAFCSVAELYMTDLCDEEEAEASCESALQKSIKVDSSNPEAYQCLASLRLLQENDEEAKSLITKSLSLWLPQTIDDDANPETELSIPEFDSRIKTSQLLIELNMFEEATQVLERLLDEDDQVFTVWYLLGWANYIHGDIYKENAYYYLKKAKEIADKNGCDDEELVQHIEEIIKEISVDIESDQELDDVNDELKTSSESDNEMET